MPRRPASNWIPLLAAFLVAMACGRAPDIHHYKLGGSAVGPRAQGQGPILVVEAFSAVGAYDDDRIVYRTSPHRLDYYHYHRWSASPGVLVADYLRESLRATGRFQAVLAHRTEGADLILEGRVIAFEEVDVSEEQWLGRATIELLLRDAREGRVLWTTTVTRDRPLPERNPEGLARALSQVVATVAGDAAARIEQVARAR